MGSRGIPYRPLPMSTYGTATDGVPPGRPHQNSSPKGVKIVIRGGKQRLSIAGSEELIPQINGDVQIAESAYRDSGKLHLVLTLALALAAVILLHTCKRVHLPTRTRAHLARPSCLTTTPVRTQQPTRHLNPPTDMFDMNGNGGDSRTKPRLTLATMMLVAIACLALAATTTVSAVTKQSIDNARGVNTGPVNTIPSETPEVRSRTCRRRAHTFARVGVYDRE